MKRVAVTGGIGSGKSYVCQLLAQRGIDIYDCDAAAKRLMRTSALLRQQLTALVGTLDKAAMTRFLLESETNAKAIDRIVHPAVARDFQRSGLCWMECAILYESGFDRLVDTVVVVTAPEELRVQRVVQRDGIDREKAMQWMQRQWPQDAVRLRADYEIINDGQQPLLPQIDRMLSLVGWGGSADNEPKK